MSGARGFTLLELVVAVAVFGLMAGLAYGGLNGLLDRKAALDERASEFTRVQKALRLMQSDLYFSTRRGIRDALGSPVPALAGGQQGRLLAVTRAGLDLAADSGLVRVVYVIDNGVLQRQVWPVLDRLPQHQAVAHALLRDVEQFEVRFLDVGQWRPAWPAGGSRGTRDAGLPRAVELSLTTRNGAAYRRVIALAGEGI